MASNGHGSVLVVGGGIGGIQASIDLADAGFKVHLVEDSPTIGGKMAQLDKTFPTNDCAMCIMSPKLVDCARHLNINLMTSSEVESIEGTEGAFTARVRKRSRFIDAEKCTGCKECEDVCPVQRPNEFDGGLSLRKAIYRPFPQASPNIFSIEKNGASPCTTACPAGCNAHGYVALIRDGRYREAIELIRERIPLPGICGRVCGFCEDECSRTLIDEAVQIRALKRFASDYELQLKDRGELENGTVSVKESSLPKGEGQRIAIVGSGPAGLTAAYDLARAGYAPTVFESQDKAGGMLRYGIPDYRLPEDILDHEIEVICDAGVALKTGKTFGKDITLNGLKEEGYEATFLALGTQQGSSLNIEGNDMKGVSDGLSYLRSIVAGAPNQDVKGKAVAVIGGGNTAVDTVRSAIRLGAAKAMMVYRRSRDQMPVSQEELIAAEEEGVELHYLLAPLKISGNGKGVEKLECAAMRLGLPDESGRRRPIPVEGKTKEFAVDCVFLAIGQGMDLENLGESLASVPMERNLFKVDPLTLETGVEGVFAGGDAAGAGGYVVHAIAHGHAAAESVARYLSSVDLVENRNEPMVPIASPPPGYNEKQLRVQLDTIKKDRRLGTFDEIERPMNEEQARAEASRCLDCGVCSECMQCVSICKADAVSHKMQDEIVDIDIASVIVATGCETYDPSSLYRLGYGVYPDVVTSLQFERILSASGCFGGHVEKVSTRKKPKNIAFIQCVGSRDTLEGNGYCSSVCCMYAIKEAVIAKEHDSDLQATIFYMDIRAHGKDFERYYERAKLEYGVEFKRGRAASVRQNNDALELEYEKEDGTVGFETFDMIVLSVGFNGNGALRDLSNRIGAPLNKNGFFATQPFSNVETRVPGIYVCGPAQEPKDIPETVMQASAAAAAVAENLSDHRFSAVSEKEYPPELDVAEEEPRVGIFVCHCGTNIGGVVDVPDVVEYAKTLPNVVYAEENLYTCSQDTQDHMRDMIDQHKLNRVIVSSCTPRTHEPLFQETIREAGLNRHLFEMANIRDQCSWIHKEQPEEATQKSKDLTRMAVAKIRLVEPLPKMPLPVTQRGLVIGGGAAGMSAALSIANQGYEVEIVERSEKLGGHLNNLHGNLEGQETKTLLESMKSAIDQNLRISVHLNASIEAVEGFVGNYKTMIKQPGSDSGLELLHGTAVLATGGRESTPTEYLYGQDKRVVTGLTFEKEINETECGQLPDSAVFIQCVGSREAEHMSCSRVCCSETVKNALLLKSRKPQSEVYVLYRDMRTFGFAEDYYRKAREAGVIFLRFDLEAKPEVTSTSERLVVTVNEQTLNSKVVIETQRVILAARIDAQEDADDLSQFFKVPLNKDGFFLEAHVKLRPVDFATEGIFLAGMAHSPKSILDSMSQGRAAAARAVTILCKDTYEAEAAIAALNEDLCDGCGICVGVCEYNALEIQDKSDDTKIVKLNEASCKGCGACVAACPSGAMEQKGFKDSQIMAEIDAALVM